MSFLSVLQKIGHVFTGTVDAIRPLAPYIGIIPGVGSAFTVAFNIASKLEEIFPANGQGAVKLPLAIDTVVAAHPGIDKVGVSLNISKMVTAMNMLQEAETALNALQAAIPQAIPPPK